MKRRVAVVGVLAGVLILAGCTKNSAGSASAESGISTFAAAESAVIASAATATAGAEAGTVGEVPADTATARWLTVYCKGIAPFADMRAALAAVNPDAGPDAAKKGLSDLAKKYGDAAAATAARLKDLPAPALPAGDTYAATTINTLATSGKALQDTAATLLSTSGTAIITTSMTGVESDVSKIVGTYTSAVKNRELLNAFAQVPACVNLGG